MAITVRSCRAATAVFLMIVVAACAILAPLAGSAPAVAASPDEQAPQSATRDDVRIFDRYIGTFRSPTSLFDDGKTEYYNTIRYRWFDRDSSIVKFTVSTVIPSLNRTIVTGEGFYGFDPFHGQLYVFGAFTAGMTGWGTVGEFDRATGARTVWAQSMDAAGVVTHVRDAFQIVDADTWKNQTRIRSGDDTEWTLVNDETYTRIE